MYYLLRNLSVYRTRIPYDVYSIMYTHACTCTHARTHILLSARVFCNAYV